MRKKSSQFKMKEILNKNKINYTEKNNHLWLYEFNYDAKIIDIVERAINVYKMLENI